MIRPLDLTATQFAGLASGYGGAAAVRALAHAQLSKHLLLIKFVVATWTGNPEARDRAVDVLTRAQAAAAALTGIDADLIGQPIDGGLRDVHAGWQERLRT
ncbi:hypothetical protein GCM10010168_09980 [Actinoplanes ianthinogenes]|uniref:Uncharacterized protein n=1 Tax=Actinoplanes ianthinogenes TaxID=122358 RepID=A0ABM7LXX2_9ACTN|nr:HEXXH motif-containing putative peptide modification protein [Actinoplanes ianthinogenes]BCJ44185.1 hypothetical protein Aiant_48420 [Actinoplanes ianthinogenes]GGQ96322.1 hypothetical protein GCM10010168_09980 [Actinoplanes ianthinogenes]